MIRMGSIWIRGFCGQSGVCKELMYSVVKKPFGVSGSQVVDYGSLRQSNGECEAGEDLSGYVFVPLDHTAEIFVSLQSLH